MKPNIILISIDTLRADHLSCYGYHKPTTPNIDKLAREGTIFRQNYSTGVWTPPGHASMLTGLYVSEHGVYGERALADNIPTIATELQANNYQTAGFVNNSQVGELVGFHKGHDLFEEVWKGVKYKSAFDRIVRGSVRKLKTKLGYMDMGASKTNNLFKQWINTLDTKRPFYAFLHYIEPHNPLRPVRPFKNKFPLKISKKIDMRKVEKVAYNPLICFIEEVGLNSDEIAYLKWLYDAEIAYIDSKIGEIIEVLKTNNVYKNTMIVITSDHGEHFGEYGLWSHAASLHKEALHVPLIIKYPGGTKCLKDVNGYTQLVDIFPTVMDITGCADDNIKNSSGISLVYDENNITKYHEYIFAEWEGRVPLFISENSDSTENTDLDRIKLKMKMIQNGKYKYVMKSDGTDKLYDISQGNEEMLSISQMKEVREKMRSILLDRMKDQTGSEENLNYTIDEEIANNLKSLGYM